MDDSECVQIGYEASQKAHNALKWLVKNDGVTEGGRTFICWNSKGKQVPKLNYALYSYTDDLKATPTEYKESLGKIIAGYKSDFDLSDNISFGAFDAATKGRMAVSYYNEIGAEDFLGRLYYWDTWCCWSSLLYGT